MNKKGSTNKEEFAKYVKKNLLRLYPHAEDKKGKRVIMKVDSGPGRSNEQLVADLRANGIYLYQTVPNATAVMQETDQSYGLFKSQVRKTRKKVTNDRIAVGKRFVLTIGSWLASFWRD